MKKSLLFIPLVLLCSFGFNQTSSDTLVNFDFFEEIKQAIGQVNLDSILPKEEREKLGSQLRSSMFLLDSVLTSEQIPLDSLIKEAQMDWQMMKKDISNAINSDEFKQAQQEMVNELKAILEEFETSP